MRISLFAVDSYFVPWLPMDRWHFSRSPSPISASTPASAKSLSRLFRWWKWLPTRGACLRAQEAWDTFVSCALRWCAGCVENEAARRLKALGIDHTTSGVKDVPVAVGDKLCVLVRGKEFFVKEENDGELMPWGMKQLVINHPFSFTSHHVTCISFCLFVSVCDMNKYLRLSYICMIMTIDCSQLPFDRPHEPVVASRSLWPQVYSRNLWLPIATLALLLRAIIRNMNPSTLSVSPPPPPHSLSPSVAVLYFIQSTEFENRTVQISHLRGVFIAWWWWASLLMFTALFLFAHSDHVHRKLKEQSVIMCAEAVTVPTMKCRFFAFVFVICGNFFLFFIFCSHFIQLHISQTTMSCFGT